MNANRDGGKPAPRWAALVLVVALVVICVVAVYVAFRDPPAASGDPPGPPLTPPAPPRELASTADQAVVNRLRHKLRYEHRLLARSNRRRRQLAIHRLHSPTVAAALNLSCATYGHCALLWRRARCESGLDPHAVNASSGASGLFQFLPSTWQTTPYARFSIWNPTANALAGGWMIQAGRSSEWVCQ